MKHLEKKFVMTLTMMTVLAFSVCSKGFSEVNFNKTLTIKSVDDIEKIESLTEPAIIIVKYSIDAADLSDIRNSISATKQPVQLDLSKTALTEIGDGTFSGCANLTNITIPGSVTKIGLNAFIGCTGLTSITIPSGVTEIGTCAFTTCTSIASITIGSGVKKIGTGAFTGCVSLTDISIPNSITEIGMCAFYGCMSLKSVKFENTRGWGIYLRGNSMKYEVELVDVTDETKNVTYLVYMYWDKTWTRL